MNQFSIFKHIVLFIGLAILLGAFLVSAQVEDPFAELTYPIPELGNCQSREDCETFCENPENAEACLEFALAHNLIPEEEVEMARRMLALGVTSGPGGCQGRVECEAYCDDIDLLEECIIFAEEHNLIPADELEGAHKVIAAIKQGITPPHCRGKAECDIYCSSPENMEECITFGEAAGLIPSDELEEARMVLQAIRQGAKPPNCAGEEECDVYCSNPENFEECLNFAVAAGFISAEEASMARKTGGRGPGGCRGEEECEAFCQDPANMRECLMFALEYDLIPLEEAEQALRMLEAGFVTGPGGCMSEEECRAYCQNPAYAEECIDFALRIGEISPEEADRALRGGPGGCRTSEECEAYCSQGPAQMRECVEFGVRIGQFTPEEAQRMLEQIRMREQMEMMQKEGEMMLPVPRFPEAGSSPESLLPKPTPSESPQSLLDPFKVFLGSMATFLEF